jgi:hypothetical protein
VKYPKLWFLAAAALSTTSCASDVAGGGSDGGAGGAGGSDTGGAGGGDGSPVASCEMVETQAECEAAAPPGYPHNYCLWGTASYVSSTETCDATDVPLCFSASTSGTGCSGHLCAAVSATYYYFLSDDGGVFFTFSTTCNGGLALTSNGWKKCFGEFPESEPEICNCICQGEVQ